MLKFLIHRVLSSLATLFLIATLVFFLLRLAPGGPFDEERAFPEEIRHHIEQKYGLDLPVYQQYFNWMRGLAHGDLSESFQYLGHSVTELISNSLPASATIGFWSLALACLIGIPMGAAAAWYQGSKLDRTIVFLSVAGVSLPNFLLASILILIFSLHWQWLPPALWDGPSSAILPVITLGSRPLAMLARLTRATVLETLQADFIRTARSKGLDEVRILFRHALRNSLIPIVTLLGPLAAALVTGSFVIEVIFQIPGLGKHFVSAIINRDYPLVMGVTLTYGVILLICNFLVDLLYGWIDPRIRQ